MLMEFQKPIPVLTKDGKEGYAIYVESSGTFENDIWCVVLCQGGHIRHYSTAQLLIYKNATFEINAEVCDI